MAAAVIVVALLAAPVQPADAASPATSSGTPPACDRSLQSLIDAAPAGSTLVAPACTYREAVTIDKPLDLQGPGAVIDGRAPDGTVVRDTWLVVAASDVTVSGFAMRYADNQPQTGALRVAPGVSRVTISDCDLGFAAGADVSFGEADSVTLRHCDVHDAGQLGVHLGGDGEHGQGNQVIDNHIHGNNTAGYDPEWEAGGLKATRQSGLVVSGNEIDDNHGPGVWCDIYCTNVTISRNAIHDNTHAGILFEVSTGARIDDNSVWGNGWGKPTWAWGAGILLSSSGKAEVDHNVIAWNATGIGVISQDRQDWQHDATGNFVHDNVIVADPDRYLLAWVQDWDGELFGVHSGNHGQGDRFWVGQAEPSGLRFAWDGDRATLADLEGTPGESGGSYVDDGTKDQLLTAAGVPGAATASDRPAPGTSLPERAFARYWPVALVLALLAVAGGLLVSVLLVRRRRRLAAARAASDSTR